MISPKGARIAFLIFFGVLVAAFLYMAAPLMKAAFLALIIAAIFHPVYVFFLKLFKQHNYIAAVVTTILSFCTVLVPVVVVVALLASNIVEFATKLAEQLQSGQLAPVADQIGQTISRWISAIPGGSEITFDLKATVVGALKEVGGFLYQFSPKMLAATAKLGINLVVLVIFLVVFLAEGSRLFAWLIKALPLSVSHQQEISREIRVMISAILLGMIGTAIVQGILVGLGFWVVGFSDPLMWGLISILAAFIPIVGAASCYIGAVIVLLAMGRSQAAVMFLIYGMVFVSSVDNIIRPLVIGSHVRLHPVLLFVALLGGVRAFGAIGIVFGPVLLAVFLASLRIYQREFTTA